MVAHEACAGKANGDEAGVVGARFVRGWHARAADAPQKMKTDTIIGSFPELKNEKTALQHTVDSRAHILPLSPKFRPEVASVGIEFLGEYRRSSSGGRTTMRSRSTYA